MNGLTLPPECRLERLDRQDGGLRHYDADRRVTNPVAANPDGAPDAQ
jgi:hypothetical protein